MQLEINNLTYIATLDKTELSLMDGQQDHVRLRVDGDVTRETNDVLVELALQAMYKKYFADKYQQETTDQVVKDIEAIKQEVAKIKRQISSDQLTDQEKAQVLDQVDEWQPGKRYTKGDTVKHDGQLYKVLADHTANENSTPDKTATYYTKERNPKLENGTTETEIVDEWVKPAKTSQGYPDGAKVTYQGQTYVSTKDYNTDEPGKSDAWSLVE